MTKETKDDQIKSLKEELKDYKEDMTWCPIDQFYGNTRDALLLRRDGSGVEAARYGEHDEFPNLPGWFTLDYDDEITITKSSFSHWMPLPELPKKEEAKRKLQIIMEFVPDYLKDLPLVAVPTIMTRYGK